MIGRRTDRHRLFQGVARSLPRDDRRAWGILRGRARADRRDRADGCGNVGTVETTERFPPRLGNLAKNARFPHSHKPIIVGMSDDEDDEDDQERKDRRGDHATTARQTTTS
jgi:hypothetical protein